MVLEDLYLRVNPPADGRLPHALDRLCGDSDTVARCENRERHRVLSHDAVVVELKPDLRVHNRRGLVRPRSLKLENTLALGNLREPRSDPSPITQHQKAW